MDKSNILVAGLGQCGGKLADTMKEFNGRYTPIYLNSSLGDIKGLHNAKVDSNVLIYSGADGSGRIRDKAKGYFKADQARVATFLNRFRHLSHTIIFASLDGGTGSGTLIEYIKMIRKLKLPMTIHVVGVLPRLKAETLNLDNTRKCIAEFEKEVEDLIDGFTLINNAKCDGMNYERINLEAVSLLDAFYGMTGHHEDGSIDAGNLENVILAKGYISILKLPTDANSIREALKIAKAESVFAIPETLNCKYGAVNVQKDVYDKDEVAEKLKVKRTTYTTYNNKINLVALGGCRMPIDDVEDLMDELKSRKKEEEEEDANIKGFGSILGEIDEEETMNQESRKETSTKSAVFVDDDDIDKILSNPDDFRF